MISRYCFLSEWYFAPAGMMPLSLRNCRDEIYHMTNDAWEILPFWGSENMDNYKSLSSIMSAFDYRDNPLVRCAVESTSLQPVTDYQTWITTDFKTTCSPSRSALVTRHAQTSSRESVSRALAHLHKFSDRQVLPLKGTAARCNPARQLRSIRMALLGHFSDGPSRDMSYGYDLVHLSLFCTCNMYLWRPFYHPQGQANGHLRSGLLMTRRY